MPLPERHKTEKGNDIKKEHIASFKGRFEPEVKAKLT